MELAESAEAAGAGEGAATSVSLGLSQIIAFSRPLNETWHLQLTPMRWARRPSLPSCEPMIASYQTIKPVGTVLGMTGWGRERQQEAAKEARLPPAQRWANMKLQVLLSPCAPASWKSS